VAQGTLERKRTERLDRTLAANRRTVDMPEINVRAFADAFGDLSPLVGPVALGTPLNVSGDFGFAAQLLVVRGSDAGVSSFVVQLRNVGTMPFDGSLAPDVWLESRERDPVGPSRMRPDVASMLGPGAEVDRVLDFLPLGVPTNLYITLHLGRYYPTAEWTVTD
jgi:hypothetical protein